MDDPAETWNKILEKAHRAGFASLQPAEQTIYRVFTFVMEVEMGGISGALYNLSPRAGTDQRQWMDLRLAAEAIDSTGDGESARMLRKAAEILESVPEQGASTWGEFMDLANAQASEEFWESIEARVPDIYEFLERYTINHAG